MKSMAIMVHLDAGPAKVVMTRMRTLRSKTQQSPANPNSRLLIFTSGEKFVALIRHETLLCTSYFRSDRSFERRESLKTEKYARGEKPSITPMMENRTGTWPPEADISTVDQQIDPLLRRFALGKVCERGKKTLSAGGSLLA